MIRAITDHRRRSPEGFGAAAAQTARIPFHNSYARLPPRFYAAVPPTQVAAPRLLRLNTALAGRLGIDPAWLRSPEGVAMLAGNHLPEGAEPIALAYAGHQFGGFSPQLGDGRAILLGEVAGYDVQLKGSGPTPFSRRGDGRAALGPVLREYLISEAMAALGLPTTRALAAVRTGETVLREAAMPGAVLTRIAASHVRVGSFQFFAARADWDGVRTLADYVIARHGVDEPDAPNRYRALLDTVISRQATLVARWLAIGFIHGVMNTDNTSISGETIDYGPCAFMDAYDPATVFSSIDVQGRYAYANQPRIMHWNMARLAEALLPLLGNTDEAAMASAQEALAAFGPQFQAAYQDALRRKIGLTAAQDGDDALAQDLLLAMQQGEADFTLTFRRLCAASASADADAAVRASFRDSGAYDGWAVRWRQRLVAEPGPPAARVAAMRAVNPAVVPRNHLVEAALAAAIQDDDLGPFDALLDAVTQPYTDRPAFERYTLPPEQPDRAYQTFCGT